MLRCAENMFISENFLLDCKVNNKQVRYLHGTHYSYHNSWSADSEDHEFDCS